MSFSKQLLVLVMLGSLSTLATADVSVARAEGRSLDPDVVSTACGAGVLLVCGQRDIVTCERTFNTSGNIFSRTGGLGYSEHCSVTGRVTEYMNASRQNGSAPTRCSEPGPGNDQDVPFDDLVCEGE